jgi:hypothetical protein
VTSSIRALRSFPRSEWPARRGHREERGLGRVRRRHDPPGQESGRVRVENLGKRIARGQ